VCAAAVIFVAAPAGSQAATPNPFYGAVATYIPGPTELGRLAAAGGGTLRVQLDWKFIERRRGAPRNFYPTDVLFAFAAKANVTILPDLFLVPRWMSRNRNKLPLRGAANREEWRSLLTDYARRYGSNGTFWTEHPEFPKHPITTWEIWNEPNLGTSVGGKPSPRNYVRLLQLSSEGLKAGDPQAKVLTGGFFPYKTLRNTVKFTKYLKAMYRVPGASASFDVLGIHPFAVKPSGALHWVRTARHIMDRNGDGAKPIVVSAFGWFTGGQGIRFTRLRTNPRQQAAKLTKTFQLLSQNAGSLGIQSALWFTYYDNARRGPDSFLDRGGLFTLRGRPKPAWRAFAAVAGGAP